ncbi:hypothetical protein CC1G_11884 [Coprinopsis cinerea okayama7|uniref:Uncharacterized protein n=1 Tax=Coprinopsis cinerea (strain Okayama-7 / 130 / ATCC MYA-4618 / FGSC 9003) TaxID=240176 RepID=A8P3J2_COPC7|nr:hypothetical protein CC1G_11884 [Coprinopsis cinerea okayama7\|eukprot:XP_001838555.1 hypothetical protein CC1G_11884 [Coprinopsis cinerea okayama7\
MTYDQRTQPNTGHHSQYGGDVVGAPYIPATSVPYNMVQQVVQPVHRPHDAVNNVERPPEATATHGDENRAPASTDTYHVKAPEQEHQTGSTMVAATSSKNKRKRNALQPISIDTANMAIDEIIVIDSPQSTPAPMQKKRKPNSKAKAKKMVKREQNGDSSDSDYDSDDFDMSKASVGASGKRWSTPETKQLLGAVIGPDALYWETYKKGAKRAFSKISKRIFPDTRNPASVKARFERLVKIYRQIKRFEEWTGNGNGDPDTKVSLEDRLNKAIKSGKVEGIATLTSATITEFKIKGYYEIFDQRFGTNPNTKRTGVYHSGTLSDLEGYELDDDSVQDDDDDDTLSSDDGNTPKTVPDAKGPRTPAPLSRSSSASSNQSQTQRAKQYKPGVPETPHSSKKAGKSTIDPNVAEYLSRTAALTESALEDSKERLEIYKRKAALEEEEKRMSLLRAIIKDPEMPEATRAIAQEGLHKLLLNSVSGVINV